MYKKQVVAFLITILISSILFTQAVFAEEGYLNDANFEVEFIDESTAKVMMNYNVHVEEGIKTIPIKAILFSNTTIDGITAEVDGMPLHVDFDMTDDLAMNGEIKLENLSSSSSDLLVDIEYTVGNALVFNGDKFDVNLPVIATTWPPEDATPGVFLGHVQLPEAVTITEGFPTSFTEESDGKVNVQLQVVPALVSFKGTTGIPTMFTYHNVVNFSVVSLIVISVFIALIISKKGGRRKLREEG